MFFGGEKDTPGEPLPISARHILRKIFLEDWVMKLIALVITLALWLGVTGLSTPTTTRLSGIPLTLRFPNNMEITNSPTQEVDIVITGDRRRVAQLNKGDLVVSVDLTDIQPGDRFVQLSPENVAIALPTGIKLDEIQPNKIAVKLEPVEEKEVPVQIETTGEVADGYEIYSEQVNPPKVRVRGPAGFIRALTYVTADPIDLEGRNTGFTAQQIPVNISNPKATILDTVVDVTFTIGEKRIERLYLVPIAGEAENRRATVVLFGGRSRFEGIKPTDMRVDILRNEAGEPVPQLILPAELQGNVEVRQIKIE